MTKMQNCNNLRIFFSGIAGSGLSAIAGFMSDKGHTVSGSDRLFDSNPDHPLRKVFLSKGINTVPQDGSGIKSDIDLAVFSTAVEETRPEVTTAKETGVSIRTRPEYLLEIASGFKTVAVSGTSGKSTASGMLAYLMKRLGLDPNFIGGGRVKQFRSPVNQGNYLSGNSDFLIIEACESDGSIVNYHPMYSIVLNLAFDHHSVNKTAGLFTELMENTSRKVLLNGDDSNLQKIRPDKCVTFSIHTPSMYRAEKIRYSKFSSRFSVNGTEFTLSLPGEYNLYNALSCIALLSETGIPAKGIAPVLPEFQGIERRFDIHLNDNNGFVMDDYAHNPHKISALMDTVKNIKSDICYIFQPHGFGPTRLMKDEYIKVFSEKLRTSDALIILPIYYAGGTAGRDISSQTLVDGIISDGKNATVAERRDIIANAVQGKNYVVLGARDDTLSDFAGMIASRMSENIK